MVINHLLRWVKNAVNFITFFRPIWRRWASRCKSTDKCASKLALVFGRPWHGLPFEMSLADVMRQDARGKSWSLVTGMDVGTAPQASLPAICLLISFGPECLACFSSTRNSRSTFWDSICLMYISQPWDLLKWPQQKIQGWSRELPCTCKKLPAGAGTYQNQITQLNHLKGKIIWIWNIHLHLVSRIPAVTFPNIFPGMDLIYPPPQPGWCNRQLLLKHQPPGSVASFLEEIAVKIDSLNRRLQDDLGGSFTRLTPCGQNCPIFDVTF